MLLSRVAGARKTGPNRWVFRCNVHDDHNPSVCVRKTDDGMILVYCQAGCPTEAILAAAGLRFSDLYPPKPKDHRRRPERRPFHAEDVLRCLVTEAQIAAIVAARVTYGCDVDFDEIDRLMLAVQRIANAATAAGIDDDERRVRERLQRHREIRRAA